MSRQVCCILLWCAASLVPAAYGGGTTTVRFPLRADGSIPVWLVAGPFEQRTVGFGVFADIDVIEERSAHPYEGESVQSVGVPGDTVTWEPQSSLESGYLDLNTTAAWIPLSGLPEQLWWAKAAYCYVGISSPDDREVHLLSGSNAQLRIFLNGAKVFSSDANRTARKGQDTITLRLTHGFNRLLLKIGNTHQNHGFDFFGGNPWGWGGYLQIVGVRGERIDDLMTELSLRQVALDAHLVSTFFFKKQAGRLMQRFNIVVRSGLEDPTVARCFTDIDGRPVEFITPPLRFGLNNLTWYLPALNTDRPVHLRLEAGGIVTEWDDTLRWQPQFDLYLMMQSHMDIGYTHPQPIVKEIHAVTLDSVLAHCERDSSFRWNIETTWELRQFEKSRPRSVFERLMAFLKSGQVSLSPFYTNPFTGWVSEEEMVRSLDDAFRYRREFGLSVRSAVYDDVPGLAWFLPQVCTEAGVDFLVCGLNEVYSGYSLQQALPKAFIWEGPDGSRVFTYRTELYSEGGGYGLDCDTSVVVHRMWERISRLRAAGYHHPLVLLNSTFLDNGGVAAHQLRMARLWNETYAFPRFVFSTPSRFADDFRRVAGENVNIQRGDWTSSWDVLFQGEPALVVRERWTQEQILGAEKLSTVAFLLNPINLPLREEVKAVYRSLLEYSGHGSGLEAGLGTESENAVTMQFREQFVQNAYLGTREVLGRSIRRCSAPEISFEREGVLVFNSCSWTRDIPVSMELRQPGTGQYVLVDLVSGVVIPSLREGTRLLFTARSVPSIGFKKFGLRPADHTVNRASTLSFAPGIIKNRFYRLAFDERTGEIRSILSLKTGREIVDTGSVLGFNIPLRERPFDGQPFAQMAEQRVTVQTIDQRPVRLILQVARPGAVIEKSEYTLWADLDRIDISHTVALAALPVPEAAEEYGVGFPVLSRNVSCRVEILGGFFDPDRDRFPGVAHDGFSLRRVVALTDSTATVIVGSPDCRVFFWKQEAGGERKTLVANLVNNFPPSWNRNENRSGTVEFRFAVAVDTGEFDPGRASRFGREIAVDQLVNHTFIRSEPAESSYVTLSGDNVMLTAMKPAESGSGIVLRLQNVHPDQGAECRVQSRLLKGTKAYRSNWAEEKKVLLSASGESFSLWLKPNEVATVLCVP